MTADGPDTAAGRGALTGRYLRHLAAAGADGADLVAPALASEHLVASYGDRFVTRPALLEAGQVDALEADLAAFFALLTSLPDRLFGGDLRAMGRAAAMPEVQLDAVLRTAEPDPVSLGRADLYADAAGFRLLEFNIVGAVGGLEVADLNRAMLRHPALASFVAEEGLEYADTLARVADAIKAECERRGAGPVPVVVITDTPGNFAPFEKRFQVMADIWSGMGLDGIACPLDKLEERSGRLFADGRPVDIVYRYFLMEDLLDPGALALIEPVLRAAEEGKVGLLSRMDAELYGSKAMLALLSDDANRAAFTAPESALIDRILPWTRMLTRGSAVAEGQEVDLLEYAQERQGELVLKPTLLHGGIGVVPGWSVSREEWRQRLHDAAGKPFIVQRRVNPVTEEFPVPGRPGTTEPLTLNWGVFLIQDRYAGTLIRGTAEPDVGVLSRATGARSGCCFHEPSPAR